MQVTHRFTGYLLATALLIGGALYAGNLPARELPNGPHIVTSGSATMEVPPDIVTLAIEVNVTAKEAITAKKQADERVSQYLDFLHKQGVEDQDIQSANVITLPDYDYQQGKSTLKGYRAMRHVSVTVRHIDKLNLLLDGALKAGLNEIRGITPAVAHPEQYQAQVRQAAIDNAMTRAKQLAEGFHSLLGPVYSVRYHVANYQPAPTVRMMRMQANAPSVESSYSVSPIEFSDQVDVVFQITPDK